MGTRGFVGFAVDGVEKIAYNHWDSYPEGLGATVLDYLRAMVGEGNEGLQRELAKALSVVPDRGPTDGEREALAQFRDDSVGGPITEPRQEWYKLLRGTQGEPGAILHAGYYEDAGDFPRDSLFCEWGYLVDFDNRVLEVYEGFRQSPPTEGRWVGAKPLKDNTSIGGQYHPVQRVAVFAFDELPTTDEFCKALGEGDED